LGDGVVKAAHGVLPVPAPATLKLLEGHPVRPGPEGAGELATPTGAALVRVLSSGPPPHSYVPLRSGFGAGTRDLHGRPNALRLVLAEMSRDGTASVDTLVQLSADIDDMDGEQLALVADALRATGALDVVLVPTLMKKGRPGVRIDVLAPASLSTALQDALFTHSTTTGVRRTLVERFALPRYERTVCVLDHDVRVKAVLLPSGVRRAKPEIQDVARVAERTGRPLREVLSLANDAAERMLLESVPGPAS
jgi:pyridinium-3,5-bisthiocarboxylic acid mononucleotide nickel chelatase